jgi:hypothetical protein
MAWTSAWKTVGKVIFGSENVHESQKTFGDSEKSLCVMLLENE